MPDVFFPQYDFLRYAIIGEGETPLQKLIQALQCSTPLAAVPSLYYRDNTTTFFTGHASSRLEDESAPDFRGLPLELYKNQHEQLSIPYRTSRGCVNSCSFCENPYLDGPWETKSTSKIVQEIDSLKSLYGSDYFSLKDNNINASYQHASDICSAFIQHDLGIRWLTRRNLEIWTEHFSRKCAPPVVL